MGSNRNVTQEFFGHIKTVVDNYMTSRKPATILMGTYDGSAVVTDPLPIPMSLIQGNMKAKLMVGDKVRLLRADGGHEYFILEIIGKPYQIGQTGG